MPQAARIALLNKHPRICRREFRRVLPCAAATPADRAMAARAFPYTPRPEIPRPSVIRAGARTLRHCHPAALRYDAAAPIARARDAAASRARFLVRRAASGNHGCPRGRLSPGRIRPIGVPISRMFVAVTCICSGCASSGSLPPPPGPPARCIAGRDGDPLISPTSATAAINWGSGVRLVQDFEDLMGLTLHGRPEGDC